ncbi:MBL fold metallo-hydrolase [Nitrospira sp. T9]|uniref:MBL fold metallo-hydrolase n=1 Tax=unclassified Nitrospira TaxID=2652172 RepID=UPI003F99E086
MKKVMGLIVLLSSLFAGAAFAQSASYSTLEVTKDVHVVTGPGYNAMFVVTSEGVIVADSINPEFASKMLEEIKKVTNKPVRYLVYSHNHRDHIAGGQVFKDAGAVLLSHEEAKNAILKEPHPDVAIPDFTWSGEKYALTLGDKTMELLYFGPNHGTGMTVYYLPKEKVMYLVDIVTPNRLPFTIIPDFDPDAWVSSLKKIEAIPFQIAVFSHEGPIGGRAEVVAQREYLADLKAKILRKMNNGENVMEIPNTIQLPKYKDWLFYKEWLPMNTWRIMLGIIMGY